MNWSQYSMGQGIGMMGVLAGTVVSSLLTLGTYGKFRDKGWGTWKAAAATGVINGLIGAALFYAITRWVGWNVSLPGTNVPMSESTKGLTMDPLRGFGLIAAQKLGALPMINVSGYNVALGGSYAVDPRTYQLVG